MNVTGPRLLLARLLGLALLAGALRAAPAVAQPAAKDTRLGVLVSWGRLPDGLVGYKGSMYWKSNGVDEPPPLPAPGKLELIEGATMFLKAGDPLGNPRDGLFIELYGTVRETAYATLADWVAKVFPPEKRGYGPVFEFRETTVGGLRAFEAIARGWSEHGSQRHFTVELDPARRLYAVILTDASYRSVAHGGRLDELTNAVNAFVASVRFTRLDGAAGGAASPVSAPPASAPTPVAPAVAPSAPAAAPSSAPAAAPVSTPAAATGDAVTATKDKTEKQAKAAVDQIKSAASGLKKSLGGLFKKKP